MINESKLDPWERGPEFPPAPQEEHGDMLDTQLPSGEMKPEEVVEIYTRQVKPYEWRANYGIKGFLSNVLHGFKTGRLNRPSEMRGEAQQEIEFRRQSANEYSLRNMAALQAQAAKEANLEGKDVGQPPFDVINEVKDRS